MNLSKLNIYAQIFFTTVIDICFQKFKFEILNVNFEINMP